MKTRDRFRKIALCGLGIVGFSGGAPLRQAARADISLSDKAAVVQLQSALDSRDSGVRETNFGDLVADSVLQSGHAEIALMPADELLPVQIAAGKVPVSQITHALRYAGDEQETVVVLHLTGAQLSRAAARSVSRAPHPFDGFLQVSGLHIRCSARESGKNSIIVTDAGGREIAADHTYRVAMPSSLAAGSLGYFSIWSKQDLAQDTGIHITSSLESYLQAHQTLNPTVEGRITAL